jgi:hypothetical protein
MSFFDKPLPRDLDSLIRLLPSEGAATIEDVFLRCEVAETLSAMGGAAKAALPALINTLVAPVAVDCVLHLRVAAAKAVWKVGGRHDIALPFLAWALKDTYWGMSLKAAVVMGEMGGFAHNAIPDLVQLAERRCARGPFLFEQFPAALPESKPKSLLAIVAMALGECGKGVDYGQDASRALTRLEQRPEDDVRDAASRALVALETPDSYSKFRRQAGGVE